MLISALLLTILSTAVIYSSSPSLAFQQGLFAVVGILFYLGLRAFDYQALRPFINISYIFILICLIVVFILGFETRGSIRWIPLGPFNFQPSEFAKPVLILILARFWAERAPSWWNIVLSLIILLPIVGLVFKQPDLGTTLTIIFIWIIMLIAANASLLKLGVLGLLGLLCAPVSWFLLHDYQKQRFMSFLSPLQDPTGIGYNVIQSMIAVGSGQFLGRGLGRGTQSRLQFLPEFRTDFIFASIAEELGLIGSLIVLGLYSFMLSLMFKALFKADNRFGELIIIGVMGMIFFQVLINIGMNIGIMPITGITLPLLSYGGSSLITTYICLGLVASVQKFISGRVEAEDGRVS